MVSVEEASPARHQREKRRSTLLQSPGRVGSARHGAPLLSSQNTASTNDRLSVPLRLGSNAGHQPSELRPTLFVQLAIHRRSPRAAVDHEPTSAGVLIVNEP